MTDEVLIRVEGVAGCLSLNRPRAIHALTLPMVRAMAQALQDWRHQDGVGVVMIDHAVAPGAEPRLARGFCSGGDIAMMRQSAIEDGGIAARKFFFDEYRLNHLLFTYEQREGGKMVVAFMDGITMGGGVGLSLPARYRVATENTRLAMPETGIGLFPDVGGGWYLSRLEGRLGFYLALTGARLDGAECLWAGLATHYLPSASLPEAKARIAGGEAPGDVLDALAVWPPPAPIASHAEVIGRLFAGESYEAILAALRADGGEFAAATLATLATKSPQTCKVALRQLTTSLSLPDFAANMAMEYRIAARVLTLPDFAEGVRALIIDKDNAPRWQPAAPEGVTQGLLDDIFAPLSPLEEWKSL